MSFFGGISACAQGDVKGDGKPVAAKQEPEVKKAEAKPVDTLTAKDPAVMAIDALTKGVDTKQKDWRTSLSAPAVQKFPAGSDYFWNLETNKGDLKVHLFADTAPMHVTSTIYLTRLGFYDGLKFHRVIKSFMAQGGCPLGTGTGGPGYKYAGEFGGTQMHNKPGILSMANAGPGTDGSQFFLTFVPTPHLNGRHTIFGEVVGGLPTLKALEAAGSQGGQTSEPLMIKRAFISVEAKPAAAPATPEAPEAPKKDAGK